MSPSCELRGGGVTQNTKLYTYALIEGLVHVVDEAECRGLFPAVGAVAFEYTADIKTESALCQNWYCFFFNVQSHFF